MKTLGSAEVTPSDRIETILSAIYHCETEFCGDILIKEFSETQYPEKIYLKNLFGTFYQMHGTTYRIYESISLLRFYKKDYPEYADEIEEAIEELHEFEIMFR